MLERSQKKLEIIQKFEVTEEAIDRINGYIETHFGPFSVREVFKGLKVSQGLVTKIVESHPLVKPYNEKIRDKPGPQKRYFSIAIPPAPTYDGLLEEANMLKKYKDNIGREAREDYFELIRVRSLGLHRGKRRFIF